MGRANPPHKQDNPNRRHCKAFLFHNDGGGHVAQCNLMLARIQGELQGDDAELARIP